MFSLVNLDFNSIKTIKQYEYLYRLCFLKTPNLAKYEDIFKDVDFHIIEKSILNIFLKSGEFTLSSSIRLKTISDIATFLFDNHTFYDAHRITTCLIEDIFYNIDVDYYDYPHVIDKLDYIEKIFNDTIYNESKIDNIIKISSSVDDFIIYDLDNTDMLEKINIYTIKHPLLDRYFDYFSSNPDPCCLLFLSVLDNLIPEYISELSPYFASIKRNSFGEAELSLAYTHVHQWVDHDNNDLASNYRHIEQLLEILKLLTLRGNINDETC